jgi:gamma-glutamyl-gamma-aminobutyrate hydrolase PuuD
VQVIGTYDDMDGISIIDAVECPDKTFAIGLQFHPEAAIVKQLERTENADENMDYETAIQLFVRLIEVASDEMDEAA